MTDEVSSLTADRVMIQSLAEQFARLHLAYCSLIRLTPLEMLYHRPQSAAGEGISSVGECVLRGAAAVEQTFGGITANLWDDPFEWTLPENLATVARFTEYLVEVEATRQCAFESFGRDAELRQEIMGPAGTTRVLVEVLLAALVETAEYYGRAVKTLDLLTAAPVS